MLQVHPLKLVRSTSQVLLDFIQPPPLGAPGLRSKSSRLEMFSKFILLKFEPFDLARILILKLLKRVCCKTLSFELLNDFISVDDSRHFF